MAEWVKDCHHSPSGCCCGVGLIPGPGTSTCCGCGQTKKTKQNKKEYLRHS